MKDDNTVPAAYEVTVRLVGGTLKKNVYRTLDEAKVCAMPQLNPIIPLYRGEPIDIRPPEPAPVDGDERYGEIAKRLIETAKDESIRRLIIREGHYTVEVKDTRCADL